MNIGSFLARRLQEKLAQLADKAFGEAAASSLRNETARGEFISAYISEQGLDKPRRPRHAP
jgi:hypothetical protein